MTPSQTLTQHLDDYAGLERRFARAERHSRVVRLLRVSIPAVLAAALGGLMLLSLFNPFRVVVDVAANTENLAVSGTKITMEAPHMNGFSQDKRPYEIWGKTAVQDTTDPDNVDLTEPRGKMLMEDGSITNVESRTGKFNNKAQLLDLYKEVHVTTSNGYEAWLNHAQVDLSAGTVSTDDGVDVKFDGGKVKADRLRVKNRGEVVVFEGHVVMDLDQSPPTAPAAQPAASGAERPEAKRTSQAPSINSNSLSARQ